MFAVFLALLTRSAESGGACSDGSCSRVVGIPTRSINQRQSHSYKLVGKRGDRKASRHSADGLLGGLECVVQRLHAQGTDKLLDRLRTLVTMVEQGRFASDGVSRKVTNSQPNPAGKSNGKGKAQQSNASGSLVKPCPDTLLPLPHLPACLRLNSLSTMFGRAYVLAATTS